MTEVILGIGASPGRALGEARRVRWRVAPPPHRTIEPSEISSEIERFEEARVWARERVRETRERAAAALGEVEANIFDPQILMLDDPDLIDGTVRYVRENLLSAERAFDWRLTELRIAILDAAHLIIVDRLADLQDIRFRVLARLAGHEEDPLSLPTEPSVLVFEDLTPSLAVRLDPAIALGLVSAVGSRTAHSAVLARSLGIPAVVGVGSELARIEDGHRLLVDGGTGRLIVDPSEREVDAHRKMARRLSELDRDERLHEPTPVHTIDGQRVFLRANIDQPHDVAAARRVGAEGVGLFRSEFLVIGRRVIPSEEEQYDAYRQVIDGFPDHRVTLRTFDIGGDKFPLFLDMPPEENPYLGWRAIRVCLDLPDLFRNQLQAAIRAGGIERRMRLLIPFVTSEEEILRTRALLEEVVEDTGTDRRVPLGVMVETPALADTLDVVGRHLDFISLGTNDLTQYSLAVDRGNARLQHLADPLHPAMVRMYARVIESASDAELDVGMCGDLAADPVGLGVLLGLGYRDFSLAPRSIPEVRDLIRQLTVADLATACGDVADREQVGGLRGRIRDVLSDSSLFETSSLSG
ncbi:MAG: phosphoenolpyruvate--protein phosphotransferase [Gemmatimonadetes bacterium]|nr:phosphoenolpyruvate--protein phosphotransferase [Gemmatimonadota bacterium]